MKHLKSIVGIVLGSIILIGAYIVVSGQEETKDEEQTTVTVEEKEVVPKSEEEQLPENTLPPQASSTEAAVVEEKTVITLPKETPLPVVSLPTPTPTPAPEPEPEPELYGYTLAEVALHASETDCWTVIDGSVYDLTSFVGRHPGGKANIMRVCGKDGTSLFMGKHGDDRSPKATLVHYYRGALIE